MWYIRENLPYAVVTDGALLKRLKGQFEDRTNAYAAAKAAMEVFSNYVNHGTKRTLPGLNKDFQLQILYDSGSI